MGGFLLTSTKNWVNIRGYHGPALMLLAAAWIVERLAMGFGGMLAGGCAVGAGVSGASVFAVTAWVALIGMWLGAGLANYLADRPEKAAPGTALTA